MPGKVNPNADAFQGQTTTSNIASVQNNQKSGGRSADTIEIVSELQLTRSSIEELVNIEKGNISQSTANDVYNSRGRSYQPDTTSAKDDSFKSLGSVKAEFERGFKKQLMDSLLGSDFKENLKKSLNNLADQAGVELKDLPNALGKEATNRMLASMKDSGAGNQLMTTLSKKTGNIIDKAGKGFNTGISNYMTKMGSEATQIGSVFSGLTGAAGAAVGPLISLAASLAPIVIALAALDYALEPVMEGLEGIGQALKGIIGTSRRQDEEEARRVENQKARIKADQEALVNLQFQIIQDAAKKVEDVWDSVLATVNMSQGYTKESMQDLMSQYAQRLRDEGLSSVVSAADISDNLAKVVQGGLSGQAAEEFAYIATILSNAMPNQDWFGMASDYATIASQAVKNGMSQQDALEYANAELETFASNVLYSSRQLAGGFSTSLSNVSDLFSDAVKIANTSRVGDAAAISGVLTAVSAVTSAISSDSVASEIVSAVTKAATGGNSSDIVALRSLAGINASNTEFLAALANNPQQVFENIFRNLGRMQTMSSSNYMEVAEGLSGIFGVSMDALAQVDFDYLANAVSQMQVNTSSLAENMALLEAGESKSNADQQRIQEINQYMIEEGLSYVLDNEAARAIQENMWAEQRANQIMENMFAVDLQGSALDLLTSICKAVGNVINILNPFSWFSKGETVNLTAMEGKAQRADLAQLLELGKVGQGNAQQFKYLTTTGQDLNLAPDLVTRFGGVSQTAAVRSQIESLYGNGLVNPGGALVYGSSSGGFFSPAAATVGNMAVVAKKSTGNGHWGAIDKLNAQLDAVFGKKTTAGTPFSQYTWATTSKSITSALGSYASGALTTTPNARVSNTSATQSAQKATNTKFQQMIDSIDKYVSQNKSYSDWVSDSKKFGIASYQTALANAGLDETTLAGKFQEAQSKAVSERTYKREQSEDEFWERGGVFWTKFMPDYADKIYEYNDSIIENQTTMIGNQTIQITDEQMMIANQQMLITILTQNTSTLNKFFDKHKEFYASWIDYYINHSAYTRDTLSAATIAGVQNAEKSEYGDAILGLAEALTSNEVNLLDPTVQQNVLLSKILLTLETIMQQGNMVSSDRSTAGNSLTSTLSSLGLGQLG